MTTGQCNWRLAHCDSQDSADEVQEQYDWEQAEDAVVIPGLVVPQIFPQQDITED